MSLQDWPKLGQYVDFKDRDQLWQVGLVIFKNEHCLKIRSQGWCQKYDEIIPISEETNLLKSAKIQPFRTIVRGYTGQRKAPTIRQHWKYSRSDHQQRLKKLEEFTLTLKQRSPQELTQFLRGQHYFYIDFLMSNIYTQLEDIVQIYQYFSKHIALVQNYLTSILQKGIRATFINLFLQPSEQQLWDKAYHNCFYQLIEAMYNIAGLQDRLTYFIHNNEHHIKQVVGMYEKHQHYISTLVQNSKLYDSILEVITHTYKTLFTSASEIKLPFCFYFSLYQLFQIVQNIFRLENLKQEATQVFDLLFQIINRGVEQLDPNDMKEAQIDRQLEYIIVNLRLTAAKYKRQEKLSHWPERLRMKICMLLLKCDKLQKKIKGVSKLKDIAQKIVKEEFFNFSPEQFAQLLHKLKFFEELFIQNEHVQLYKKSVEFVGFLYKYQMISVDQLCFVWNASINKHPMIVTPLLQFWIDMASIIQGMEIEPFARIAINHFLENKPQSAQFLSFFLEFTLAIVISNSKSKDDQFEKEIISKVIAEMTVISYKMVLLSTQQNYFPMLVSKYGIIVIESPKCNDLIEEIFKRLEIHQEFQVCLQILHQVYVSHDKLDMYAPQQVSMKLIDCLKRQKTTLNDIRYILSIMNCIISGTNKVSITNKEFQILWEYFQVSSEEYKMCFYEWILPMKSEQIYDNISSHINIGFNYSLKKFILTDILSNQSLINYSSLSKKELSIILQLFIEVNLYEGRIQRKKILEGYRFIHRVKSVELSSEVILWNIFEQCKQSEVIQYLNRYIIKFYFYLSSTLSLSLKKSRVDDIMQKIIENIKGGNLTKNNRLVRHSLSLLQYIFELVREDEKNIALTHNNQQTKYYIKLEIRFSGHTYRIEVPESDTISHLKCRLAQRLKLKFGSFKLQAIQQTHASKTAEELDFVYKNISVLTLRRAVIEIVQEQESIPKFVTSFIDEGIQNLLITMLENEAIATEVFMVIEQIELKFDKSAILNQINSILEKQEQSHRKMLNIEVYYHLLEIKIYNKIMETEEDVLSLGSSKSFQRILKCMKYPIQQNYQITFISKLIHLFTKLFKKASKATLSSLNLQEYVFASLLETVTFLIEGKNITQQNKEFSIKIAQNLIYIIEGIVGSLGLVNFLVSQPELPTLIQNIYLNHEVQEIRMLFTEKINICLTTIPNHPTAAFTQSIQTYLLHLFVDNVYFKIKEKELKSEADCGQNDAVNEFCCSLSLIIRNIDPSRFQKTQIIQPIEGRHSSLFEQSLNFIESLKLFTNGFHWNSLLCGHLNILAAIYYQQPSLLSQDIIVFIVDFCLGLTNQDIIAQPLCKKPQHINQAFKFLFNILHINKQKRFIKIILDKLKPCHQLEYWRSILHWNINLKQQAKQDFRGLLNPGCICYMNSLLQQLYMIDQFRNAVLGLGGGQMRMLEDKDGSSEEIENKAGHHQDPQISNQAIMLQSLKEIFLKLKFSEENSINPTSFAKTIKTNDNKPLIKFNQQMDIDEFASILFEKIQRGAKYSGAEDFIKKLFRGVYVHQIISKECSHKSEREEQFISISLQVKQNILKSFESLVKTEILDGSNKYHCQKCDKKVKAEKIQTIKQLPPYLILCLKRFEFDYEIDAKIKINDYCQFPQNLNLLQYSQQQILRTKQEMLSEDQEKLQQPPSYFNYHLRGVVVHTGSADSGHYYSFIDNRNGSWYQFNDQEVLPFELDRLPEEAFGCRSNRYDLKTKNAYLLLYERAPDSPKRHEQTEQTVLKRQDNSGLIQKILKKNRDLRKFQLVFSDEYELLIRRLEINLSQIESNIQLQIPWFQFELSYYFLVKARKDNINYFMVFSKAVQNKILSDPTFCVFLLSIFASPKFIEEFFIFNPIREKCKVFAYLLEVALQKQYQRIKHKSTVCKNEYLFKVFACLKATFIHHSLVSQLLTTLRKFLDHLLQADDYSTIYQIIEHFGFQKVILYIALNLSFEKKLKTEAQHYCVSKELEISFLAPVQGYGRKQHQNNYSEAWKIVTIILNFCNQFLERPQTQMEQKRDLYLNLMSNLKHCFGQQNIENKIISLMMESSSQKAMYYFYHTLKELKLHIKILPAIQKALKDFESIKFRPFFLYLETAITDKDTTPTHKAKILDLIERAYKVNEKYFLQTDLIHQWILRLVSFDEEFLQALEKRRTFTQEIWNRITKNPYPSTDLSKKFKHQITQRINNRCLGIMISTEMRQYELNSARMKKQFQDISNFQYRPKKDYRPPEDNFKIGEQIQYFDVSSMKWKGARIQENNFGQLTLIKDGKDLTPIYLWEDSQKIRKILPNRVIEPEATPCESDISCESSYSQSPQK